MAGGEAAPSAGPASEAGGGSSEGKAREAGDGSSSLDWVEALRGDCEPEQHWRHRREFLTRNAEALSCSSNGEGVGESAEVRRLAAFSMVWANHVFLGCRYPQQVMEKVLNMSAGITVPNAPTHTLRDELVAKVKRGISSSNEGLEEPCKKRAGGAVKASEDKKSDAQTTKAEVPMETGTEPTKNVEKEVIKDPEKPLKSAMPQKVAVPAVAEKTAGVPAMAQKATALAVPVMAQKAVATAVPAIAQKVAPIASSVGVKVEPRITNFESTTVTRNKPVLASSISGPESRMNYSLTKTSESKSENMLPSEKKDNLESAAVLASKSSSHVSAVPAKVPLKLLTSEDAKERQPFFNRLYKAVAWKLVAVGGFSPTVNHVELLNSSIQSVKATLDVDFVPLKELTDLPQNKSSQENVVCELRCKSVYLGTGCGKSKENAKAVASREALKLFLKKKVIVKLCKRKYKGKEVEDLVLLDEESKPLNLPPALRNPQEIL